VRIRGADRGRELTEDDVSDTTSAHQPSGPAGADDQARVEAAAAATEPVHRSRWALLARAGEVRNLGLLIVLAVLAAIGAFTAPNTFLQWANVTNILTTASVIGVVSVGMTFVIIGGGIDLSVGALVALAGVWSTTVATQSYGTFGIIFTALAVASAAGLVNGILIAYGRLVPFIITLAMLVTARGVAEQISDRKSQIVTVSSITSLAEKNFLGLRMLVWILLVVTAVGWVVLNRTTFGRRTFAIGGNAEAARLAGIDVRRHAMLLYVVSGFCCGIAALMLVARTNTGASSAGNLYELDSIAAVIIGGTLLTGGRGSIIGSLLGVLVFTTITNIFVLNNLSTPAQEIAKGLIIVAAVLLQRRTQARSSP
jgi:ribose transport system permease protein